MNRREFMKLAQMSSFGVLISPVVINSGSEIKPFSRRTKHILLTASSHVQAIFPNDKRTAFGWSTLLLEPGSSLVFKADEKIPVSNLLLRVTVATELRDIKLLHVTIPGEEIKLGTIDIRYSSVLVPYEIEIDNKYAEAINRRGLKITLEAKEMFGIFKKTDHKDHTILFPHILASKEKTGSIKDFLNSFMSVNSIQAFGWREGTVLDGLWQLYVQKKEKRALEAIDKHLALYFDKDGNLKYENSYNQPRDNKIDGIESTIPYATLVRLYPQHPILKTVIEAWKSYTKPNGMVTDGLTRTAEGCYTVAYPMSVIGKAWNSDDLKKNAIEQLRHRFVLIDNGALDLRYNEGKRTYRNWARGAAWFLLGFARTISELKDEIPSDVIDKFREGIDIVLPLQRSDGLWNCFMHRGDVLPDTSGSAGISAAILTGIHSGVLSENLKPVVQKCWSGLQSYIAPDGLLRGVGQDNRGGENLQASDYRVIAQMGMGMMAQLYAALSH